MSETPNGNEIKTPEQLSQELARNAQVNPANEGASATPPPPQRRRIPLSVPRRKLEVSPIPGYVLYWFLENDIIVAAEGGYDFVDRTEVRLNQRELASSSDVSGNTDLGSRVSIIGNKFGENGKPERLVLMKIREDWWKEDRADIDAANAAPIQAIFGPEHKIMAAEQANPADSGTAYVKQAAILRPGQRPGLRGGILNRGLPKKGA